MTRPVQRWLVAALFIFVLTAAVVACRQRASDPADEGTWVKVSGTDLGVSATTSAMPSYPEALRGSAARGVVIAALEIAPNGVPERVTIVEAAHPAFGRVVIDTLKRWRFEPVRLSASAMPSTVRGKLVFYFERDGTVFSPTFPATPGTRAAFASNTAEGAVRHVEWEEAMRLRSRQAAVIVTTGTSGQTRDGILNIPVKDLAARARAELPPSSAVLLCAHADAALAARVLRVLGYADVAVVEGCA